MYDIFISYNSHDVNIAVEIAEMLKKNNISNWIAPLNINGGIHYAKQITPEIRNCKIFLLIASKYSIGKKEEYEGSNEVLNEIQLANNYKKLILPVKLDDALDASNKIDEIEYLLARAQWIDLSENKNIELVVASIKSILDKSNIFLEEIEKIREENQKKLESNKLVEIENYLLNKHYLEARKILKYYSFSFYEEKSILLSIMVELLETNITGLSYIQVENITKNLQYNEFKEEKALNLFIQCILSKCFFITKGLNDVFMHSCVKLSKNNFKIDIKYFKMLEQIECVDDLIIDFF